MMGGVQKGTAPAATSAEEDPNAIVACSSPPCFMHELDPSYLGYLSQEEVRALLGALLAAEWGGAAPDEARLRSALRRHLGAPGGPPDREPGASSGEALGRGPDRPAPMIREALPRIHCDALRRDLEQVLDALGRGAPRRGGLWDEG